ncbi:MAG: GntR family transcriptional regulator [Actinobacteria bacterium]|nr:GntR family transcriptional regulator [Actinomycetota bacterium]
MSAVSATVGPRLQRSSTIDEVASLLRADIVSGELAPGTQLREVALAESIGVSRPSLREALQVLRQEGLVRHEPHRGTFVTTIGPEEIVDIYQVRRVLEGSAARACRKAAAAEIARVGAAFEELAATFGGDPFDAIGADLRFHQSIVALLGSARLDAVFESVVTALRPCLVLLSREAGGTTLLRPASLTEHEEIADAIAVRRGRDAERLVIAHVDRNQELLLEVIGGEPTEEDE